MPEFKQDADRIYKEALGFLTEEDKKREFQIQIQNEMKKPNPSDSLLKEL